MFGNNNTPFNMPVMPAYGNNGGFGGLGDDWLAIIIILAIFGWGGFGGGNFGGMGGGAAQNYVLASDFATIQRQLSDGFGSIDNALDAQNNGICNLGYTQLELANSTNMNVMQGFNNLQAAVKDCCCQTQQNIKDVNYNLAMMGNGIERTLEKGFCDTNYNMATQNCQTLQAIDKVGDRIIDYLANQETQKLRDQLAEYRDREGRQYVINELNKCPIPAYLTCNPNAPLNYNVTYGNGCGCA